MVRIQISFLLLTFLFLPLAGQGIFEQSLSSSKSGNDLIHGFTRGCWYGNFPSGNTPYTNSIYGQTSIQISARSHTRAQTFADLRLRSAFEYGSVVNQAELREAWVNLKTGAGDFRIGKQILAWGRADGFNPTDNLTPVDYFVRSHDTDEMRLGNWALTYNLAPVPWLKLELAYLPVYQPSVYRFDLVGFSELINFGEMRTTGYGLKDGTLAAKVGILSGKIEGSISYFRGYDLMPFLAPGALTMPPEGNFGLSINPTVFRQEIFGADFSAALGKTALRGEIAWRNPSNLFEESAFIPESEWNATLSIDRSFGKLHMVAAWAGKWVENFIPMDPPGTLDPALLSDPAIWPYLPGMIDQYLAYANRLLFEQTDEWMHRLILRPSLNLFHETLSLEANIYYNLTTGEHLIWPSFTWSPADRVKFSAGYQYYQGKENTRIEWIKELFSGPYIELKLFF